VKTESGTNPSVDESELRRLLKKAQEAARPVQSPETQKTVLKAQRAMRGTMDPAVQDAMRILIKPSPAFLARARLSMREGIVADAVRVADTVRVSINAALLEHAEPEAAMADAASRLKPLGPDALGELVQSTGEDLLSSWPSADAEPVEPAPDAIAALWLLWTFALAYMSVFYGDEMPEGVEKCIDFALVALGYVGWLRGGRRS
jgi:hypothetical protein